MLENDCPLPGNVHQLSAFGGKNNLPASSPLVGALFARLINYDIRVHILPVVLPTFPVVLVRRICITIKTFPLLIMPFKNSHDLCVLPEGEMKC